METILQIKNRYWLFLILPALMFSTRYILYFWLRAPMLKEEDITNNVTFSSFMVYNCMLGIGIMLLYVFMFFVLLKGISYLWADLDNRKLLKIILIAYCAFFVPDIVRVIYFSFFHADFALGEMKDFNRVFYLEQESNTFELGDDVFRIILSSISYFDLIFFVVVFLLSDYVFDTISTRSLAIISFLMAIVYFSITIAMTLMMV